MPRQTEVGFSCETTGTAFLSRQNQFTREPEQFVSIDVCWFELNTGCGEKICPEVDTMQCFGRNHEQLLEARQPAGMEVSR